MFRKLIVLFSFLNCALATAGPGVGTALPKHSVLILGIDGVSYQVLTKMRNAGYFRYMKQPAPMISSFPSISDPTWALIMGTDPMPSYTKEYFDPTFKGPLGRGLHVGSLIDHITKAPPYELAFDYKPEGVLEHLAALAWIETTAFAWMDGMESEFLRTRYPRPYFAFNLNTDLISHTKGSFALSSYLAELDTRLHRLMRTFQSKYESKLELVLVSDHGNSYGRTIQHIDFKTPLEAAGFRLVDTLKASKDVAVVIPEILSFGAFYCKKGDEMELARRLSTAKGVHVTFTRSGLNQIDFFAGVKNHTRATLDPKKRTVHYRLLEGKDPLEQVGLFAKGPLSWERYKLESVQLTYPYALVRAWQGLFSNVQAPADVLVSAELGWAFAGTNMKLVTSITGLISMHGSLHRDESLGIFVSSERELPPISADEFSKLVPLGKRN